MSDAERIRLSAAVLVYNGMSTIQRCIETLGFCDEIIVVDDYSTDGTWEYLQKADVRAFRRRHTTFADQRIFASTQTKGAWLLTMDADEYVTPELEKLISQAIAASGSLDGFYIKRRNPYPRGLNGIIWSSHPRLVRTDKCRWVPTESPHAPLDTRRLRFGKIKKAFLDHEPVEGIAMQLRKSINRGALIARQKRNHGTRSGILGLLMSSLSRFLKIFFLQGGFRFGRSGFIFACLGSFEAFCKYAFLIATDDQNTPVETDGGPGSYPQPTPGKKSYI